MPARTRLLPFALLIVAVSAAAQSTSILGDWREPGGSVIRIARCGQDVCARLVAVSPDAPSAFDAHNPDPARRHDRLCGLQIGYGFHQTAPGHAEDGRLYDPKSGKTYHGEMTTKGDRLDLHGYVGIRAFGRSEYWTRASATQPPCS